MSERQDIHVHVEQDEPRRAPAEPTRDEQAAAASFFSAQILWILLIAVIVILILAAFGSGVVDLGGDNGIVDPTAAP
ncbi:MAG: hypothetical protein R3A46_11010 [Thermomicrobiales bacterium]